MSEPEIESFDQTECRLRLYCFVDLNLYCVESAGEKEV